MLQDLQSKFVNNFITDNRWQYLTDGLIVTLQITLCAVILGIVLGFLVAIVRSTHDRTGKLKILNVLCNVYLTVIRGTPVVVQLLIIYFVIFGSTDYQQGHGRGYGLRYQLRSLRGGDLPIRHHVH